MGDAIDELSCRTTFVYLFFDHMIFHCIRFFQSFQIPIVDDELRKAAGDEKEGKIVEYSFRIHVSCSISL